MDRVELVHWSIEPVTSLWGTAELCKPDMKPKGLWVSDDSDEGWRAWCKLEEYTHGYQWRVDVEVDLTRVLLLDSPKALEEFSEEFGETMLITGRMGVFMIDWERVSYLCSGILITPYRRESRLGRHLWYYGWDCSSGCIWDPSCVTIVKQTRENFLE